MMLLFSPCLISQVTPWCIHHWHGPTWWQSLPCTLTLSTTRISQDSLLSDRTSWGKKGWGTLAWIKNCFKLDFSFKNSFKNRIPPALDTHIAYVMCICCCLTLCISCSLPLGSQVIAVPVNSSLSWHTNRLRDNSKDAYNVSYAWKLVGVHTDCIETKHLTCVHWWLMTFTFTVQHFALGLD